MNSKSAQTMKIVTAAMALFIALSAIGTPKAHADEYGCEGHVGVIGAIIGGVIGHQIGHGAGNFIATVMGAMVGSSIDRGVACNMQRRDREEYERAMHERLYNEYDPEPYDWRGEQYQGSFIMMSEGSIDRTYCREYRSVVSDYYGRVVSVRTGVMCQRSSNEWYPEERRAGWYRRY